MRSKVNLADVVVAQYGRVSSVGGIVSGAVVDGAAGGEGQTCLQPVFFDEPPGAVLQLLTEHIVDSCQNTPATLDQV